MNATPRDSVRRLGELIRGIPVAMLTTVAVDGSLHARPMVAQEGEFDGTLWFFTKTPSGKVDEVAREEQVCLTYASPEENRYVSVSGAARVVRDASAASRLWSPMHETWSPDGLADPQLALLAVEPRRAEYWDASTSRFVPVVGIVEAALAGQAPGPAGHGELELGGG
jgi:general stress protein 26